MGSADGGRPSALVTGASAGIGAAFARRLARDGFDVILVARRGERLEELARELRAEVGVAARPLAADLATPQGLRRVERAVADAAALELLVNNAGFAGYEPFARVDPDLVEQQLYLHDVALTRLTRAALPGMLARGRGAVVNVSSMLAFSGSIAGGRLPPRAVYAGTKAYINTFTQLLAAELAGTGVQVQALSPAMVRTEFHGRDPHNPAHWPYPPLEPEALVEASLAGLRLGEVICVPTLEDPGLLESVDEAQRRLFQTGLGGRAAARYAAGPAQA